MITTPRSADWFRRRTLLRETRTVIEPLRLVARSPTLARRARRQAAVIVLPGLGADDLSTAPLRWYLQRIGHHVEGWELGVHAGPVTETLPRFVARLERGAHEADRPVALVGWSMGGVIAREAGRDLPDLVEQVITFGSPIGGSRRRRRPIRVPVTAIYSRNDGVVDWRSAIDHAADAVNIEVHSSHLGLGLDPDVWENIATALDRSPEVLPGSRPGR